MASTHTQILTKDSYDLEQLMLDGFEVFRVYNEEVEKPFREMFTQSVSDRVFNTDFYSEMEWDEIAEGEHLGTGDGEQFQRSMLVKEFGRALGWNRQHVERHGRSQLVERIEALVEGFDDMEHNAIQNVLFNSAADGSELWFTPPDKGSYEFDRKHNHKFGSTSALFDDDKYADSGAYTADSAHTFFEHIQQANSHLRHHQKDPKASLISSQLKRYIVNEMSWDADYWFPEAENLRGASLEDVNVRIDGVPLIETPWLNDLGDSAEEYKFYTVAGNPVARNAEVEPEFVRDDTGAPLIRPDHLFTAHGYARVGYTTKDPLAVVEVNADNLK
jgi:hypothetical protein